MSAEPVGAPAPAAGSAVQGSTNSSGPPALGRDGKAVRIAGKVLLVIGGAALLGGLIMAYHYKQGIGDCSADGCLHENVRTPLGLGIATGGAMMAMVGTCLWLSVPDANASVGLGPSSVVLAGRF